MAQYGYSAGYQGGGPSAVPSGFIESYAQAGRNIGQGIQQIGNAIGESLQRYGQNKQENEFLQTRLESLAPYLNTVAQSGNIMDKNSPESKLLGDIEKFSSMSLPQKKATLLNAEFFLDRADKAKAREIQDIQAAAARQQLQLGGIQLGQAQREEAAAPYFTQALSDVMSMQPGQAPSVPYSNVTQEMLGKYGDKLTPTQMQSLIPMMRRMGQTLPAGLVPVGAKMGPSGMETEYGVPQTLTSVPLEGSNKLRQQVQGGKAVGAPYEVTPQTNNAYLQLSEPQQKTADKFITDFNNEKTVQNLSVAGSYLNQMNNLGVGTPQYKPSDDIALIFSFMKTLDPGSTVREGEFATAANAGGIPDRVVATYNKALKGEFLADDEQRNNFINTAKKSYFGLTNEAKSVADRYRSMAKDRGIPENLVVPSNTFQQAQQFGATNTDQTPYQEGQTSGGVKYKVLKK